jgi:hypothetical protein
MKLFSKTGLALAAVVGLGLSACAQVILDDTWADGTRNNGNLPWESAWFSSDSSGASLTAAPGSMTGAIPTGSVLWTTFFAPAGSPVTLAVGDVLTAKVVFTPTVVGALNTSRGLRLGLYNFANGGTRMTADGYSTGSGTAAPGANVLGYMLNMNFGTTFGVDSPLQIMERTAVSSINLMGASGDYTTLSSGPAGSLNAPAFRDGVQYTLQFSVTRTGADSADVTTRFSGDGLDISHTATDSAGANAAFDAFAIRPSGSANVATSLVFSEFEVTVIPEPSAWATLAALASVGFALWRRRGTHA